MKMGLLWYDADPKRSIEKKIDEAAERYREKFGVTPNTCYVSLGELVKHPSLKIVSKPIVQTYHYLVGVDEETGEARMEVIPPAVVATRRRTKRTERKAERSADKPVNQPAKRLRLVKA